MVSTWATRISVIEVRSQNYESNLETINQILQTVSKIWIFRIESYYAMYVTAWKYVQTVERWRREL